MDQHVRPSFSTPATGSEGMPVKKYFTGTPGEQGTNEFCCIVYVIAGIPGTYHLLAVFSTQIPLPPSRKPGPPYDCL